MKKNPIFYAFIATTLLACLCAIPARQYATRAYTLWLSHDAANAQQFQLAARHNHAWAIAAVALALAAVSFLVASLRRRTNRLQDHLG